MTNSTRSAAIGQRLYGAVGRMEARSRRLADRSVTIDGFDLAYFDGGPRDAPVVVLLHGFSADRGIWVRFAGHLRRSYRVVIPDLAGHGRTPFRPGGDYTGPAHAERVVALLDHLGIPSAHVCGNSMGGFIAATMAIAHPDRLRTLGLADAAGVSEPSPGPTAQRVARGDVPFFIESPDQFTSFFAATMARPPFTPGLIRAALAQDYIRRGPSLREMWGEFYGRHWLDADLHRITTPTYIFWGAQDQFVDVSAATVWRDGIAGSELHVYDDLGHLPMFERPRRTARDYRRFLAAHDRAR